MKLDIVHSNRQHRPNAETISMDLLDFVTPNVPMPLLLETIQKSSKQLLPEMSAKL